MSWHDLECCKCGKINWVECPDPEPGDLSGYDYDGFKCHSCKTEQSWPGEYDKCEEFKPGISYMIADGLSPRAFAKNISS